MLSGLPSIHGGKSVVHPHRGLFEPGIDQGQDDFAPPLGGFPTDRLAFDPFTRHTSKLNHDGIHVVVIDPLRMGKLGVSPGRDLGRGCSGKDEPHRHRCPIDRTDEGIDFISLSNAGIERHVRIDVGSVQGSLDRARVRQATGAPEPPVHELGHREKRSAGSHFRDDLEFRDLIRREAPVAVPKFFLVAKGAARGGGRRTRRKVAEISPFKEPLPPKRNPCSFWGPPDSMAALPFVTGTKANSRGLVPCDVELMKSQVAIWKAAPVLATGRLLVSHQAGKSTWQLPSGC